MKAFTVPFRLSHSLRAGAGLLLLGSMLGGATLEAAPAEMTATTVKEEGKAMWMTDFAAAKALAAKEKKILLLSFSGSDWCGWCIKLDNEVFDKPEFKAWAEKNAVLVKLDFPRKLAQSEAIKQQNEKLAQVYQVEGFPTVILARPDGSVIAQTGYQPGGAAAYVKHLESINK